MSIQPQLTLTDYADNKSHLHLSQQPLGHKVGPVIAKDSPKRSGTEGVKCLSQILSQSLSLTSVEQDWEDQELKDSDFCPHEEVQTALHPIIQ